MLRFFVALPLLVHGLAHICGFLASWTKKDQGFKDEPWLLSRDVTLHSQLGRAFGLLWLMSMVAFIGAGFGIILKQFWWPQAVLFGSVLSLIVILPLQFLSFSVNAMMSPAMNCTNSVC